MHAMDPRVIIAVLLVLVLTGSTVADEECYEHTEVIECNGSCFEVVKPMLAHFRELKSGADKSNELKYQLVNIQKELQIKDDLTSATIKSKDEQIKALKDLIKSNDALIKAQSGNEELIRIIKSEISQKNNEIKNKEALINSLRNQINEKSEDLKKASEEKDEFNKKLLSCLDNINKSKNSLMEKEKEIQENKEEIKRKDDIQNKRDAEIQEKTEQAKSKDFQNKNLTSQINVLSQNLTITIEKLGKCVDPNPCNNVSKDIYQIRLPGVSAFEAPCNGSGWMVIQRRMDGRVNFNRNWVEYRDGFGNLAGEFFLGLEKLHLITQSRQHELLIHLGKLDGSTAFEKYDNFRIGSEKDSYPLQSVGNPTGGAGDTLTKYHLNMKFSTIDRDNDVAYRNCASYMGGGLITVDTAT
ncbi:angiopoietin-related protein 7 [Drosophila ananassae]|uniref:angiopoietin-related protein 7 n=1 Tax=Drosophila ananassae TaxID=7217 RepID=UPI001CFFEC7C|nr:angiopoietin-related protein 7 [Drosophila ananassae]